MVTILSAAFTLPTGIEHERTTSPFRCTEHAPHCATPHPYLVPVRPTCSRITQSSGVSGSTCTSRTLPFTLSFAMGSSRDSLRGQKCAPSFSQAPRAVNARSHSASARPEVALGLREQAVEPCRQLDRPPHHAGTVALEPVTV